MTRGIVPFPDRPAPPASGPLLANPRFHEAVLLVASILVIFTRLGETTLASYDDTYYAEKAEGILLTGEWLAPPWDYTPTFDNTPLYLWGTAVVFRVLGVTELAARLLSAAAGVGCVLLTYRFGRRLFGHWVGFFAGAALLTTPYFIEYSRHAMLDTTQTLLVGGSLYLLFLGTERARTLPIDLGAGALLGLAALNKSVLAYLVLLVYLTYVLAARVPRERAFRPGILAAAGLGIAIPGAWFVSVYLRHGDELLERHFGYILWERATLGDPGQTIRWTSYLDYFGGLFSNFLPWIPLALWGAWKLIRGGESRRRALLPICWAAAVLVAMSLPAAKKSWYVMPAYPALAILAGYGLDAVLSRWIRGRERFAAGLVTLVLVFLVAVRVFPIPLDRDRNRDIAVIAPEVRAAVAPREHVLCFGLEPHWRYVSPLYFYADRPLALPEHDPEVMERILRNAEGSAILTDAATFERLAAALDPPPRLLAASGDLRLLAPPGTGGDVPR